jgi:peptidoglycan/xylan/chitin deacetylase (PgdA/CDA1 family)
MRYITTSWDDGYPADRRLSELLAKYELKATFYVPRSNEEHRVMEEQDIYALSRNFEVGGHTLHHSNLTKMPLSGAVTEIRGCYDWLSDLLQEKPVSFCPPFGAFGDDCAGAIYEAGFRTIRTTELLSTDVGGRILNTTLQVFPHSGYTYLKHLLLRRRLGNLRRWRRSGYSGDLFRLLDHYLEHIEQQGGCFHLWGHSWEIEENNDWDLVEAIFRKISRLPGFNYVENRGLPTPAAAKTNI